MNSVSDSVYENESEGKTMTVLFQMAKTQNNGDFIKIEQKFLFLINIQWQVAQGWCNSSAPQNPQRPRIIALMALSSLKAQNSN